MNIVAKYKLFKNFKHRLSCANRARIKSNLDLVLIYLSLPKNIQDNEDILRDILEVHKNYKYTEADSFQINSTKSLPFNNKKIITLYKNLHPRDIFFIHKNLKEAHCHLLKYFHFKNKITLLDAVITIKNKMAAPLTVQVTPEKIKSLNHQSFQYKSNTYQLEVLFNHEQICTWSVYLDNCLNTYLTGKMINIFDMASNSEKKISYKIMFECSAINLIAIYKNNKPYALLELIDRNFKIKQIKRKRNMVLPLIEQHNILTQLEKYLKFNLEFAQLIDIS